MKTVSLIIAAIIFAVAMIGVAVVVYPAFALFYLVRNGDFGFWVFVIGVLVLTIVQIILFLRKNQNRIHFEE